MSLRRVCIVLAGVGMIGDTVLPYIAPAGEIGLPKWRHPIIGFAILALVALITQQILEFREDKMFRRERDKDRKILVGIYNHFGIRDQNPAIHRNPPLPEPESRFRRYMHRFFAKKYAIGPTGEAPIVGDAELMVFRLALEDLHIDKGWNVTSADFGVFVRMSVASTGRPRTVRKFILRATYQQDGSNYEAESAHNVGRYFFHYYVNTYERGFLTQKTIREPMGDLAEVLRKPLLPDTHAEGWVRFETKNVRHQLRDCRITIHAVDAIGHEHEIETTNMTVRLVEDDEYATKETR